MFDIRLKRTLQVDQGCFLYAPTAVSLGVTMDRLRDGESPSWGEKV